MTGSDAVPSHVCSEGTTTPGLCLQELPCLQHSSSTAWAARNWRVSESHLHLRPRSPQPGTSPAAASRHSRQPLEQADHSPKGNAAASTGRCVTAQTHSSAWAALPECSRAASSRDHPHPAHGKHPLATAGILPGQRTVEYWVLETGRWSRDL